MMALSEETKQTKKLGDYAWIINYKNKKSNINLRNQKGLFIFVNAKIYNKF